MSKSLNKFWSVGPDPVQKAFEDSAMQECRARLELNPDDNAARLGIEWIQYIRKMQQILSSLLEPPAGLFNKAIAVDYLKFEVQSTEASVRMAHDDVAVADIPYSRGDPNLPNHSWYGRLLDTYAESCAQLQHVRKLLRVATEETERMQELQRQLCPSGEVAIHEARKDPLPKSQGQEGSEKTE